MAYTYSADLIATRVAERQQHAFRPAVNAKVARLATDFEAMLIGPTNSGTAIHLANSIDTEETARAYALAMRAAADRYLGKEGTALKLKEEQTLYVRSMGKALRVTTIFTDDATANAYMARTKDEGVVTEFPPFIFLANLHDQGVKIPEE